MKLNKEIVHPSEQNFIQEIKSIIQSARHKAYSAIKVDALFQDETAWLSIEQMSTLFGKSRSTINEHILNVYKDREPSEDVSMRKIGISDFSTKPTNYYNLDVIISVGYRVKSQQGTQFRIWATQRLHEYIQKGFTMDDERLKGNGNRYFRELLQRVRDIRSSERNLYQQVTDIYATAVDYDPRANITRRFFAAVQNKMHYGSSTYSGGSDLSTGGCGKTNGRDDELQWEKE